MRIIVLSGYNEFEYAKEALSFGALSFVLKPLNPKEEIQIVLKRYLERIVLYFYRKEEGNS